MRECDECTKCCEWPQGTVYGHNFGGGKPCNFLKYEGRCSIYSIRPEQPCRTYFCAWAQELFPEWMRPDKCGTMISVENGEKGQFLRATSPEGISKEVEHELNEFGKKHGCDIIK